MTDPAMEPSAPERGGQSVVRLSESAHQRVVKLLEKESEPGLKLRVYVQGGGCSGFQYGFVFDRDVQDDDHVFHYAPVDLVVDEASLELLAGSEVDYVESLGGSAFRINNPNAAASCGCGSSFSV